MVLPNNESKPKKCIHIRHKEMSVRHELTNMEVMEMAFIRNGVILYSITIMLEKLKKSL